MNAYADSSFITALYLKQTTSERAIGLSASLPLPLPFTPLHRLEVRNSFRLAVFRKEITSEQAKAALRQLETNLEHNEGITHCSLKWTDALRQAEDLGAQFTELLGTRAYDLLHVATAREFNAEIFLTFDPRQAKLANAAGLLVRS